MATKAEAFRRQAQRDMVCYRHVLSLAIPDGGAGDCSALHFLQMAVEKLAKAVQLKREPSASVESSHQAVSGLVRTLKRPDVTRVLGRSGKAARYRGSLESVRWALSALERLHPQLAGNGPNLEYPWSQWADGTEEDWVAPAQVRLDPAGLASPTYRNTAVLSFIDMLLERFGELP